MSIELPNITDEELIKSGARSHLRLFGQYVTPAWEWGPQHWKLISQKLMQVERGEIKRLMIFSPPRHGKSELGTIHFPAWYMLRNPDRRVIVTSYSADLAYTFSRRTRALVRDHGPDLFNIGLSKDSKAVDEWDIEGHHGKYIAAGVGGPITGQGAGLLIIDDPLKNAEEANSPTTRQKVWDWFTSTAYTRLEPDGAVVITLTRWHDDDLAGRLIKQMGEEDGEQWEILNLPAIAENTSAIPDALGREDDVPLWPERFNLEALNRIKRAVGSYVWSALYQQRPQDLAGGAFKAHWFKWYSKNEISFDGSQWHFRGEPMILYQGVDPAISEKTAADDFVIFTMGITQQTHKLIIFEAYDDHLDFPDQVQLIIKKYQEWLPERVGIEINAYQRALKQQVVRDALIPVKQLDHRGDKYTRILSMSPFFENGQVHLRMALPDEPGYVDQTRLPDIRMHVRMRKLYEQAVTYSAAAAHDDILDACQNVFDTAKPKMSQNEFYQY